MRIYEGEVLVVAGDALLNAKAHLLEESGFWGGFLTMRSTAGAELVMDAHHTERFLTFDTENPHAFSPRRTNLESPVVRITGLGRAPGQIRMIPDPGGKKTGTTG